MILLQCVARVLWEELWGISCGLAVSVGCKSLKEIRETWSHISLSSPSRVPLCFLTWEARSFVGELNYRTSAEKHQVWVLACSYFSGTRSLCELKWSLVKSVKGSLRFKIHPKYPDSLGNLLLGVMLKGGYWQRRMRNKYRTSVLIKEMLERQTFKSFLFFPEIWKNKL